MRSTHVSERKCTFTVCKVYVIINKSLSLVHCPMHVYLNDCLMQLITSKIYVILPVPQVSEHNTRFVSL